MNRRTSAPRVGALVRLFVGSLLGLGTLIGCSPLAAGNTPAPTVTELVIPPTYTSAGPEATGVASGLATPHALPTQPIAEPTDPPRRPRLSIPEISVEAEIVNVPIVDGQWDVSELGANVGWLPTTGEHPGADYAPALAAHVSTDFMTSGPFGYLWDVPLGGEVVLDWGDTRYRYAIAERLPTPPDLVQTIYIPDGDKLVLVTCNDWNFLEGGYQTRLVVIAELESTEARP